MRRGEVGDAPALAALHARAFQTGWSARALSGFMSDAGTSTLVSGDPPQGFILIRTMAGEAEVLTLAVDPSARRAGVGRMLVEASAASAAAFGAASLFLEVAEDNTAALALYRTLDFVEVGRRRGYYRRGVGPAMDALVLKRILASLNANTSQQDEGA